MKIKRIAVALAVTALGATLASRWRRGPAGRNGGTHADPDPEEPPDEDMSAFIETLERTPIAAERRPQAGLSNAAARHDGAAGEPPASDVKEASSAHSNGLSDSLRG